MVVPVGLIDRYLADGWLLGRITSELTESTYRRTLALHLASCDASMSVRADIMRTLRRWTNPNTYRQRRSMLVSFYDWMVQEGLRSDNPARATPIPASVPTTVDRLSLPEYVALLKEGRTNRDRRVLRIGSLAGLRRAELIGLQGRHFDRKGWLHVSADIAKGGRERWIPVVPDLADVATDIRNEVDSTQFVLPSLVVRRFNRETRYIERPNRPTSPQAITRLVAEAGERAGITQTVNPHLLRYAFADFIAGPLGLPMARALLGHASIQTTDHYLAGPSLDEMARAVEDVRVHSEAHDGSTNAGTYPDTRMVSAL